MMRHALVAVLVLLASPAWAQWTERQKQIIGRLIVPKAGGWAIRVEGGTAEPPWLTVTGTLGTSGAQLANVINIVTAGSASAAQRGLDVNMFAGYTGSDAAWTLFATNTVAGTSVPTGGLVAGGNRALVGSATASTAGANFGVTGYSENTGSGYHIGGTFTAFADPSGRGYGLTAMGSTNGVGVYASLRNTAGPFTLGDGLATALIADNGSAAAGHIIAAKTGAVTSWQVGSYGTEWAKSGTKALTDATATLFVRYAIAAGSRQGGIVKYCVEADDGTDFQTRCGTIPWAGVNKAGTETCTVGTASDVVAVSAGTLTVTFDTETAGTNTCGIRANATSSLTETTLRINYAGEMYGNSQPLSATQPQ